MNHDLMNAAIADIRDAEMRFGIYSEEATRVRAYWFGKVEPEKFPEAPYPEDLRGTRHER